MQTKTKSLAGLLATLLTLGAVHQLLPFGKNKNEAICTIKPENIHLSTHELAYNNSSALKIKVRTICSKNQICTSIDTQMYEIINGKEHLVIPFNTVHKTSKVGSTIFYFKDIFHECPNARVTQYIASFKARIELKDHSIKIIEARSNKSLPLACGLY